MTLLEVKGLSIHYPSPRRNVRAVEDVDLSVAEGQIVGLAGESGSGKSTLALGITRLLSPPGRVVAGEVKFDGVDLLPIPEPRFRQQYRWKKIAMVFQGSMNGFTPVFTIGSQIEEVLRIHGEGGGGEEVERLLKAVELDADIARRFPHELSGGQKQRAFIAMALALRPRLLIADEVTTALDVITQAKILNLLKSLRKDFGISILLISHDLALLSEAVDALYIMYAGRVVEEGSAAEIFIHAKHPYSQGLLAAIPTLQSTEIKGMPGSLPDPANLPPGCSFNPRCPFVMERCRVERPELRGVKGGERVACWLY